MIYIIGSGPSGVSAALALLKAGKVVTILDYGNSLEAEKIILKNKLKQSTSEFWDKEIVNELYKAPANIKDLSQKITFGSTYIYKGAEQVAEQNNSGFIPGFSKGGFSNVWGASLLPFKKEDFADWPIKIDQLSKYYSEVLSFVPTSAKIDELEPVFPVYKEKTSLLNSSSQIKKLAINIDACRGELGDEGIIAGFSRLAVDVDRCTYCGMCLEGCPYDAIYSTAFTLEELCFNKNFTYIPFVKVLKVVNTIEGVEILFEKQDTTTHFVHGKKCLIGAGPLNTAQIVKNSVGEDLKELTLLDSQYFILPIFQFKKSKNIETENLYNLCQYFLEINNRKISKQNIHLQIYSYSYFFKKILLGKFKFVPFSNLISKFFLERLLIIQGYLHSDESSKIKIRFTESGEYKKLLLEPNYRNDVKLRIKLISNLLKKFKIRLGIYPIDFQLLITTPGKGFHCGGTFPMSLSPSRYETDTLGRLGGIGNIHIIDSSVFPSIPSATITFTIMANAYRIALNL